MINIEAIIDSDGSIRPASPPPSTAVIVVGTPAGYACYMPDDELPAEYQQDTTN